MTRRSASVLHILKTWIPHLLVELKYIRAIRNHELQKSRRASSLTCPVQPNHSTLLCLSLTCSSITSCLCRRGPGGVGESIGSLCCLWSVWKESLCPAAHRPPRGLHYKVQTLLCFFLLSFNKWSWAHAVGLCTTPRVFYFDTDHFTSSKTITIYCCYYFLNQRINQGSMVVQQLAAVSSS